MTEDGLERSQVSEGLKSFFPWEHEDPTWHLLCCGTRPMRSLQLAAWSLTMLAACGESDTSSSAFASRAEITDGVPDDLHHFVGKLRALRSQGASLSTATLIGRRTVLGAGHALVPGAVHESTLKADPTGSRESFLTLNGMGTQTILGSPFWRKGPRCFRSARRHAPPSQARL